ncbi:hypothetical protein GMB86_06010 [Terrilactibacillus sp. BCM23-1]|uniref:Uncharacterized protein n=2 Tax=Terrilactibacillus tamarindi TaxID=2599694 RepID=A0A6N8CPI6_9BACI|nr:hypothetical protein [Terrilactibacillus tamarindi]
MKRKDILLATKDLQEYPLRHRTTLKLPQEIKLTKPSSHLRILLQKLNFINLKLDDKLYFEEFFHNHIDLVRNDSIKNKGYQINLKQHDLKILDEFHQKTGYFKSHGIWFAYLYSQNKHTNVLKAME